MDVKRGMRGSGGMEAHETQVRRNTMEGIGDIVHTGLDDDGLGQREGEETEMLEGIWEVEEWMDRCMLLEDKKEARSSTGTEFLTIEEKGIPLRSI